MLTTFLTCLPKEVLFHITGSHKSTSVCPKGRGHRRTLWNGSYTLDCSLLISSITFAKNSSCRRRSCARAETRKTPPTPQGHKHYGNIIVVFSTPLEYWHLSNLFIRRRHHQLDKIIASRLCKAVKAISVVVGDSPHHYCMIPIVCGRSQRTPRH